MSLQTSALCLEATRARALYAHRGTAPVRCTRERLAALRANKPYQNVAELLMEDPRTRALLRMAGVEETFVTGKGADLEVFRAFCEALQDAPANATALKAHATLQWMLDIPLVLCRENADEIWTRAAVLLTERNILPQMQLEAVDALLLPLAPTDPLEGLDGCGARVIPLFCPDALLSPGSAAFLNTVTALVGKDATLEALCKTLPGALDRFSAAGCKTAVHGVLPTSFVRPDPYHAEEAFRRCMRREVLTEGERDLLVAQLWRELGREYVRRGMSLELSTGGASAGVLQAGQISLARTTEFGALRALFDYLRGWDALPRIALYLSAVAEVREAVALGELYPARDDGPQISLGILGGSLAEERALLLALAGAMPLGGILGRVSDLRAPASLFDGEIFCRALCTLFAELEEEGMLELPRERVEALVSRITGKNQAEFYQL